MVFNWMKRKNINQTYQSWLAYTLRKGSLSKPEDWVRAIVEYPLKKSLENREYVYLDKN